MMYRAQRECGSGLEFLGLGASPTSAQIITAAGQGVSTGVGTKSIIAGSVAGGLATAALFDPEPISKAILAISAAFVGPLMQAVNRGCGQTCIVASQSADQAGAAWDQIKQAYWSAPMPRPRSLQQAALTGLKNIADTLQAACSNPALGEAGRRCISERLVRGGTAPWCPGGTGCDFWTAIYDPIANDPNVGDPSPVDSAISALGLPPGNNAALGLIALGLLSMAVLI